MESIRVQHCHPTRFFIQGLVETGSTIEFPRKLFRVPPFQRHFLIDSDCLTNQVLAFPMWQLKNRM